MKLHLEGSKVECHVGKTYKMTGLFPSPSGSFFCSLSFPLLLFLFFYVCWGRGMREVGLGGKVVANYRNWMDVEQRKS